MSKEAIKIKERKPILNTDLKASKEAIKIKERKPILNTDLKASIEAIKIKEKKPILNTGLKVARYFFKMLFLRCLTKFFMRLCC